MGDDLSSPVLVDENHPGLSLQVKMSYSAMLAFLSALPISLGTLVNVALVHLHRVKLSVTDRLITFYDSYTPLL